MENILENIILFLFVVFVIFIYLGVFVFLVRRSRKQRQAREEKRIRAIIHYLTDRRGCDHLIQVRLSSSKNLDEIRELLLEATPEEGAIPVAIEDIDSGKWTSVTDKKTFRRAIDARGTGSDVRYYPPP